MIEKPIEFSSAYSRGNQREQNEDSSFTFEANLLSEDSNQYFGLFIVADGMGGHQYGEIASTQATRSFARSIVKKLYLEHLEIDNRYNPQDIRDIIHQCIIETNQEVIKVAPGGGSTLTSALIIDNSLTITHIGDSRCYYVPTMGNIQVLTEDHSYVGQLIKQGNITQAEALSHPQRNILYQAIGQKKNLNPDIITDRLPEAGHLLLCTDGLWGSISDRDITQILKTSADIKTKCNKLVLIANKAGGVDNITAILIKIIKRYDLI